jgi:two-component system, OmpR family, phosphate regulon sensor histidine kinase PhoR
MSKRRARPLFFFYLLVTYVLLQFGWWTYLLVRMNREAVDLRRELIRGTGRVELDQTENKLSNQQHKQWLMIGGEGVVFLTLLVIGIVRTRNSFRQEVLLADRQKNFLLSVTHELKSPLASARLQHETMMRRELSREQQVELLNDSLEDIDRLRALVDNILLVAQIENSAYLIHPEKQNISKALTDLCDKARHGFARTHQLHTTIEPNEMVAFDSIALHSIVINLLENAVKYTPKESSIVLKLTRKSEYLLLVISDEGPGIPSTERSRVFEKFYRIGNEETRSSKGTGLGLFIVRYLIQAHHWALTLGEQSIGARFEIRIPLA